MDTNVTKTDIILCNLIYIWKRLIAISMEEGFDDNKRVLLELSYLQFYELVKHDTGIMRDYTNFGITFDKKELRNRIAHLSSYESKDLLNFYEVFTGDKSTKYLLSYASKLAIDYCKDKTFLGSFNMEVGLTHHDDNSFDDEFGE